MSLVAVRKKRSTLYLSIAGLMFMVAAVSAISTRDPSGASLRIGMVMVTVGAAMWLPWRQLAPAVLLAWLAPNFGRSLIEDYSLFGTNMMLELPGLLLLGAFASIARESLRVLEQEDLLAGSQNETADGLNLDTGVYEAAQLRPALESELARSRRFGRTFAVVLVGIDEMRQKFDYRDAGQWNKSLSATARLLRNTRHNVDRVFYYGATGFAMVLPESTENDVAGMVRRLRRLARKAEPAEGEPGGPLPAHYGATFFPVCATSVDDLLRRAEVAMRIAERNTLRYQLDSAEAPEMPAAETLRRGEAEVAAEVNAPASRIAPEPQPQVMALAAAVQPAVGAAMPEQTPDAIVALPATAMLADTPSLTTEAPAAIQPGRVLEPLAAATAPPEPAIETPRLVAASSSATGRQSRTDATGSLEDIASLLRQMDETLAMIKTVRAHAV